MMDCDELTQFLIGFADTFMNDKPDLAANCCVVPNIIIGDHSKKVFNSKHELEHLFMGFNRVLAKKGIARYHPIVNQTLRLSDSLYFTNMRWQLMDHKDDIIISWATSYTLQKMDDGQFKIIITVVDDDKKQLEQILPAEMRL
jgi:hypothetical protein